MGMEDCEDREYQSKELTTNDILNNRILESQIEEVENNENQPEASASSRAIFAQRQNSMSMSNLPELSQISLLFTPSQPSMTMTDQLGALLKGW